MTTISKDTNRENLGGNTRLQILLFHDLFKIYDAINGQVPSFDIFNGSFVVEIDCTLETIDDIVKKKRSRQGTIFNVEINGQIPKTRLDVRNQLEALDNKKFVVLLYDNNGNIRLFGDLRNPMRFDDDADKRGRRVSNINAYEFSLTGQFNYRPYYVNPEFTIDFVEPIFQHLFDGAIDTTSRVEDTTDLDNDGFFQGAWCLLFEVGNNIILPSDLDLTGYELAHDGTATLVLDDVNNEINTTFDGTVFNIRLTKLASQSYTFPCCEGHLDMLHDVELGERAWKTPDKWVLQSQYFYLNLVGGDQVINSANTSQSLFVSYNALGGKVFNGKADNQWYAGIDYKVDMIIKREGTYYRCNTAHTSFDWDSETGNWTAL